MKRTGTIQAWRDSNGDDQFRARIRLDDGTRTWVGLPAGTSKDQARALAAGLQKLEDERGELLKAKREGAAQNRGGRGQKPGEADAAYVGYLRDRIRVLEDRLAQVGVNPGEVL